MSLLRDEDRIERTSASASPPPGQVRYEDDVYSWALQQADLLRTGLLAEIDVANLADEIADVADREDDKRDNALLRELHDLLKWDGQPERRSRSRMLSIKEHRARILDQIGDHAGLKSPLDRAVARAYRSGRSAALSETDLPDRAVPDQNPCVWADIMDRPIVWPEGEDAREREA